MEMFLTNPWIVGIGSAVAAGLILYFVFGVGKSKDKDNEEEPKPEVHADIVRRRDSLQLEIINTGTEDIIHFRVVINWLQTEGSQSRTLNRFFYEHENPITMPSTEISTLRNTERVYATSIPLYSTNGRIKVHITGEGANTHEDLEYSTTVENEVRE